MVSQAVPFGYNSVRETDFEQQPRHPIDVISESHRARAGAACGGRRQSERPTRRRQTATLADAYGGEEPSDRSCPQSASCAAIDSLCALAHSARKAWYDAVLGCARLKSERPKLAQWEM
jgi:hypothetical protein